MRPLFPATSLLTVALAAMGAFLIGSLVEYTVALFQRIPHLIG